MHLHCQPPIFIFLDSDLDAVRSTYIQIKIIKKFVDKSKKIEYAYKQLHLNLFVHVFK